MKNLYTSDEHFWHNNIIKYCNRPFENVEEMNEIMIRNWNNVTDPEDNVYVIGDFSFGDADKTSLILNRLMGNKHLIIGNHDSNDIINLPQWSSRQHYLEVRDSGHKLVLCHYKFSTYNKSHRGALNLYGHSHGSIEPNSQQLDVGVDCWNFTPVTIKDILKRMSASKPFVSADYHEA